MDRERNNYNYCWQCQDYKKILGHSEIDCPNVICRKCGLVGHIRQECPDSLHPKTIKITPNSEFTIICGNCGIVEHSESKCPYPALRIVGIVTPRCEFCYGGHNTQDCVGKSVHDFLNKVKRWQKAKRLAEKEAKIDKRGDLDIRVVGMSLKKWTTCQSY